MVNITISLCSIPTLESGDILRYPRIPKVRLLISSLSIYTVTMIVIALARIITFLILWHFRSYWNNSEHKSRSDFNISHVHHLPHMYVYIYIFPNTRHLLQHGCFSLENHHHFSFDIDICKYTQLSVLPSVASREGNLLTHVYVCINAYTLKNH